LKLKIDARDYRFCINIDTRTQNLYNINIIYRYRIDIIYKYYKSMTFYFYLFVTKPY